MPQFLDFEGTKILANKIKEVDKNLEKSNHTHSNKSIIDKITQTLLDNWNSAFTHISDAVKHITSAERTLWNTVSNKAEKTHTHTKSQITDMPTSLKNPTALTVQFNGATNKTYDGSSTQIVNITPSAIGAAASSHTHNYAGSSSAGGAANTAVKIGDGFTATGTPSTTEKTNLVGMINEVFQNASNGKSSIATAITSKGVNAAASETFDSLANKIKQISTGVNTNDATATADKILSGQTAYVKGSKITGTMSNKTNTTTAWCGFETISVQQHPADPSQGLVTIPITYSGVNGYYGEGSKITGNIASLNAGNIKAGVKVGRNDGSAGNCITGTFTSDATAQAGHILSGQTAYVNANKVTGTMANLVGQTVYGGAEGVNTVRIYPSNTGFLQVINTPSPNSKPHGYIDYTTKLENHIPLNILASALGITANKIVSGNNICGVNGSATVQSMGGVNYTSGSLTRTGSYFTVSGLPFTPNLVITTGWTSSRTMFTYNQSFNSSPITGVWAYNEGKGWKISVNTSAVIINSDGFTWKALGGSGDTMLWWAFRI